MFRFRKNSPPATTAPQPPRTTIRLKVMRPEKFSDAPLVADELIMGRTVVMNLEAMEREACRHLLDFISGVTYALDGSIKRIAGDATFIVTPNSVALADAEEAEEALRSAAEAPVVPPIATPPRDPVAAMFSTATEEDE